MVFWETLHLGLGLFAEFRPLKRALTFARRPWFASFFLIARSGGPYPHSTAGTFRKKFRKDPGNALRAFPGISLEGTVRLGCPKPYNSRHLRLPGRFQNSLPPSTAGDASFFRIGSGEGLSELVMEFPAVLGVFLTTGNPPKIGTFTAWNCTRNPTRTPPDFFRTQKNLPFSTKEASCP